MIVFYRLPFLVLALGVAADARAVGIADLLAERLKSVVMVEFTIQTEIERRQVFVSGAVTDTQGTIIIPGSHILPGYTPEQLKDFKVYGPNTDRSESAIYLGQDSLTGFHFIRMEDARKIAGLVPITAYPISAVPQLGEELWGIGMRGKDEDFAPYVLSSRIAMLARLPNHTALTGQDIGAPGLPVFNLAGEFAGLTLSPFGRDFLLFSRNQHGTPVMLLNAEESSVVLLAREFLPFLERVPRNTAGRPVTWMGIYGLQPVDPDVAKLLRLEGRTGLVVSDIKEGSPAAQAGLRDRDIVLAIDGEPLPRLKPDRVVVGYFGQEILKRQPGEKMKLTVLRGSDQQEFDVVLADEPKMVREAERRFFDRLGFTAREFLVADSILHRALAEEQGGAVVHFLKPNGPAATAGLRPDDWIREIDGAPITSYLDAVDKLAAMESDARRAEFVLLTSRGGETQVLRIKLN